MVAWLVYKVLWSFFGEKILVTLYPKHYQVWAGTELPPATGYKQQIEFLRKVIALQKNDGDLFDDIIVPGFERDGYTVQRTVSEVEIASGPSDPDRAASSCSRSSLKISKLCLQHSSRFDEAKKYYSHQTNSKQDFETGAVRRGALYPALGDSIFTSDGR